MKRIKLIAFILVCSHIALAQTNRVINARDTGNMLFPYAKKNSLSGYVPYTGTTVQKPLLGDFYVNKPGNLWQLTDGSNSILFDKSSKQMVISNSFSGVNGSPVLQLDKDGFLFDVYSNSLSKGIYSNFDYTPNKTPLSFAQYKYVDTKLSIIDTANMLLPYARKTTVVKHADTALMLLPYLRKADTSNLNNKWSLTGNSNTTASNFIGTKDAHEFKIKANNIQAINVDTTGKVCIGCLNSSGYALGVKDLIVNEGFRATGNSGFDDNLTVGSGFLAVQNSSFLSSLAVGFNGGINPLQNTSAVVELRSTTKGLLIPRMTTTQRDAIATAALGLQIINTTTNQPEYYNGTVWVAMVGNTATGTAGGDLAGTYPNPTLANTSTARNNIGLGNVNNTSDANKPISTATQTALNTKLNSTDTAGLRNSINANTASIATNTAAINTKEPTVTAGTTTQYYRGDKTFVTLDKTAVGLANVDNTSDANKPISTATQTALNNTWSTTGNTGTNSGTNFLGTTDNVDLVFKRNNSRAGLISGTNSGFGNGGLVLISSGTSNCAFGNLASTSLQTGVQNTALGAASLQQSTVSNNIGLGFASGKYNTNTSNQVFINSIDRTNYNGDTTLSIYYGIQTGAIATQRAKINGQLHLNNGTQAAGAFLVSDAAGISSWQTKQIAGTATLDFPTTAAQTSTELTLTVTGAADGDVVSVGVPSTAYNANSEYTARVSGANTVSIAFNNFGAIAAINPNSGTFKVIVFK